jgi:mannosyltransferase OCH1-like enzyme
MGSAIDLEVEIDEPHSQMLEEIESEFDGEELRTNMSEMLSAEVENIIHQTYQNMKVDNETGTRR